MLLRTAVRILWHEKEKYGGAVAGVASSRHRREAVSVVVAVGRLVEVVDGDDHVVERKHQVRDGTEGGLSRRSTRRPIFANDQELELPSTAAPGKLAGAAGADSVSDARRAMNG